MWKRKDLGHGIGLRNVHFQHLLEYGPYGVDWFEIISENFFEPGGRPWRVLEKVRAEVPIVIHGVSLGIGNTDPIDKNYLQEIKHLEERIEPAWVSDHICWGAFGGHHSHDLLPLPYTEETIAHVVERVQQVQDFLQRPILLENVSSYVGFVESEMPEWEFVTAIAKRSGSGILLDLNNIYVSGHNHHFDPVDYLNAIPVEHVGQFHIAGHSRNGKYLIDTHTGPTIPEVWELYRKALQRFGPVSTLIEWDTNIPPYEEVVAESKLAYAIEQEVLHGIQVPAEELTTNSKPILGVSRSPDERPRFGQTQTDDGTGLAHSAAVAPRKR